jgi:hypothetical protein
VQWLALVLVLIAACDRDSGKKPPPREPQPPRRIIEPPTTGIVRPLPPHAIKADGVGPYKIGDRVAALLQQLPSGPRIMRFELPGVVRTSVFRAEEDASVIIGGETTGTVTFVGVVGGSEIARTEKFNVHVGSTVDALERALGPFVDDPDRARDPRLVIPSQQRNMRAVLDDDRIAAIVVTTEVAHPRPLPESSCERPAAKENDAKHRFPSCLTSAGEYVEVDDDEVIVRNASSDAKIATLRIPNLLFAEPLRNLNEGRDEIVAVTMADDAQERRWSIVAYRLEGTRFVRSLDSEVIYEMTNARTRWIGAELRDVQLYLEMTSQTDGIEVGGLLTTQTGSKIRDVAVISPIHVSRKSGKSSSGDAGGTTAGTRGDAGSANP